MVGYFTFNKRCSAYFPTGPLSLRHKLAFNVEGESGNKDDSRVGHADTTRVELDDHPLSDQLWEDLTYAYDFPTANTTNVDEFFELIDLSSDIDQGDANKNPISGYTSKVHVQEKYRIVGFISSGTYGRVYKAVGRDERKREYAIKKFVPLIMVSLESIAYYKQI